MLKVTLKEIHDRCEEVGDCWIWQQAVSTNGYPILRRRPGPCLLVRRVVVELAGRPAATRQPVVCSCDEKLCCNPAHLKSSSNSDVGKKAAKKGAFSGKARGAKIAASKRAAGKLTMDDARAIRASSETGPILAARYGVNRSLIQSIRTGKAWKDYSNPFGGLMGGARG